MGLSLRAGVKKSVHGMKIHWKEKKKKKFQAQWSIKKIMLPGFWNLKKRTTVDFFYKNGLVSLFNGISTFLGYLMPKFFS